MLILSGCRVDPIPRALGQSNEVGHSFGRLTLKELAGDAAHGGVHDHGGAVGMGEGGGGGLGCIRQVVLGVGRGDKGHG